MTDSTLTPSPLSFSDMELAPPLKKQLAREGFETPTPIQAQAIPHLLQSRDLLGIAQTGTGKTAAFTLPLIQRLSLENQKTRNRSTRALILAPTRELALQIAEVTKSFGIPMHLRQAIVMGGVAHRPQIKALERGVDILIATPGRLLDLVNQGHLRLDATRYLVLDEADRMFDMGFIRDIRKIVEKLPATRQSLFFSATMPKEVEKLAREILTNPERVEVTPKVMTVEKIDQKVIHVPTAGKRALLNELLAKPEFGRVIIFTRTKHGANRLSQQLDKENVRAQAIHGNKSQNQRQAALDNFRKGRSRVLVATDIAARGIDVDDVTHVINYDLPVEAESYVHRIGRTARAGQSGIAISFCDASERKQLRAIERFTKQQISVIGEAPANDEPAEERRRQPRRRPNGQGKTSAGKSGSGKPKAFRNGRGKGGKPSQTKQGGRKQGGQQPRRRQAA